MMMTDHKKKAEDWIRGYVDNENDASSGSVPTHQVPAVALVHAVLHLAEMVHLTVKEDES